MKKHLIRVGNSYALIIEKSIRKLLYLGPRSILEVSTDGQRIIIEPTGKLLQDDELSRAREILSVEVGMPPPKPLADPMSRKALDIDTPRVWKQLERFGISSATVQELHHNPKVRWMSVYCWMTSPNCGTNANEDELATLRRMRTFCDLVRADTPWEQAIQDALRAFPKRDAALEASRHSSVPAADTPSVAAAPDGAVPAPATA